MKTQDYKTSIDNGEEIHTVSRLVKMTTNIENLKYLTMLHYYEKRDGNILTELLIIIPNIEHLKTKD